MLTVFDLPRNDLAAVRRFVAARGGVVTGEEWRVMFMLQDDPAAFEAMDIETVAVDRGPPLPTP